jgi:hypothetical protein
MTISEGCSCGATFEVDAEASEAAQAALGWRATHRHEVVEVESEEDE